ncbi:hypothetical protein ACIPPS_24430 [Streptomyces sp. NPDC090127]|uniref:hypothetical protein n=1 Tax=Streptomyces sp. NPDC090127 TaxID=3365953 RepID=UPI003818576D
MTYDRLVCANCAAPVAEGRCRVCRASRERLDPSTGLTPAMVLALVIALLATLALLAALQTA